MPLPTNPNAGTTCLQASPWPSGFLSGGLKGEELKSEELAEEGCVQHKGFSGLPSAGGETGVCSGLLQSVCARLLIPRRDCNAVTCCI